MSSVIENTTVPEVKEPTRVQLAFQQVKAFTVAELLTLQATLAVHVKNEFKKEVKALKAAGKVKRVKDPNAPKKELSIGMRAYQAFVKDLIEKQPDLFTGLKPTEKQQAASKYKDEHKDEYAAFVSEFIATHQPTITTNNDAVEVNAEPEVKAVVEPEVKVVAEPEVKPKKVKADKPKSDSDKPKKVKADKSEKSKEESKDSAYKKIEVDGVTYWKIKKTNEVYECLEDGSFGEEVGTFDPATSSIKFA
jgi:hypothetical protein